MNELEKVIIEIEDLNRQLEILHERKEALESAPPIPKLEGKYISCNSLGGITDYVNVKKIIYKDSEYYAIGVCVCVSTRYKQVRYTITSNCNYRIRDYKIISKEEYNKVFADALTSFEE